MLSLLLLLPYHYCYSTIIVIVNVTITIVETVTVTITATINFTIIVIVTISILKLSLLSTWILSLLLWNRYCCCHHYCTNIVTIIPIEIMSKYILLMLYMLIECLGICCYYCIHVDDVQGPWRCYQGLQIWLCIALLYRIVMYCATILFVLYCFRVSFYIVLVRVFYFDRGNLSPWTIISSG